MEGKEIYEMGNIKLIFNELKIKKELIIEKIEAYNDEVKRWEDYLDYEAIIRIIATLSYVINDVSFIEYEDMEKTIYLDDDLKDIEKQIEELEKDIQNKIEERKKTIIERLKKANHIMSKGYELVIITVREN